VKSNSPMTEARHRAHLITVRTIEAHPFMTSDGTAFTLVNGMLIGTSKGAKRGYNISIFEVLSIFTRQADSQQKARALEIINGEGGK
jgi:hypothetical protein